MSEPIMPQNATTKTPAAAAATYADAIRTYIRNHLIIFAVVSTLYLLGALAANISAEGNNSKATLIYAAVIILWIPFINVIQNLNLGELRRTREILYSSVADLLSIFGLVLVLMLYRETENIAVVCFMILCVMNLLDFMNASKRVCMVRKTKSQHHGKTFYFPLRFIKWSEKSSFQQLISK